MGVKLAMTSTPDYVITANINAIGVEPSIGNQTIKDILIVIIHYNLFTFSFICELMSYYMNEVKARER